MSIDKNIKAEVLKVYDTWLYSYLNGDVATYNSYLDDAFHFIGSTANEEFLDRTNTTNFFEVTAEQLNGKTQLRNETKIVEQFDELIFITHLFDAWFLAGDDWTFYSRFRFTNALQKNEEGWKFIYQHYSTPDSKAQDGETIGYDQVSEENIQLREAIQRRTKELEDKNRELEIEGALQRIRAEAVAMKESTDLLDIVVTMRTEFTKLGHEAQYFWHMMWLKDTYEKAMTSGDGTKIGFVMELPRHIHGEIPLLATWEKSTAPLVVYPMDAEQAIDYVDKMINLGDFKNIDPQAPTHDDIRQIGGLTFVMARTTHGEIGYSLPGNVENPPEKDLEILEKFAGAFDLAHQRFLDLQKTEQQAREVKIELALEKVRSRSMAMQSSEELTEAGALLYQELSKLGIQHLSTGYTLFDENTIMGWSYGVNPMDGSIRHRPVGMNHTRNKVMKAIASSWKKQEPVFVIALNEKETIKHQTFIAEDSIDFPLSAEKLLSISPKELVIHTFNFKQGYLLIVGGTVLTSEQQEMITRFANVFQQTYTRFLDLQKAEVQTRKAQIELALERVRSRSMAMHSTTELQEVINIVHTELLDLNLSIQGGSFIVINKDLTNEIRCWGSGGTANTSEEVIIPYYDKPFYTNLVQKIKKGPGFFTEEFTQKEKQDFFAHLFTHEPWSGLSAKEKKEILTSDGGYTRSCCVSQHTSIFIVNHFGRRFSEVENEILARFGNVFEQTYTRFLDLQKAEAQAREAQIEAALERVRSRATGMQKSDELVDVAMLLREEMGKLGVEELETSSIYIVDEETDKTECWFSIQDHKDEKKLISDYMTINLDDTWVGKKMFDFYRSNSKKTAIVMQGKNRVEWITYCAEKSKRFTVKGFYGDSIPERTYHLYKFNNGFMGAASPGKISDESWELLKRATSVFSMAYTRFSDLKKAEAQAREAQIENALEKVRSRTMAMQHSEELPEAANVLFTEVQSLGIPAWSCGYNILSKDKKSSICNMSSEGELQEPFVLPLTKHESFHPWHKAITNGDDFFVYGQEGKELVEHYNYMKSLPELKGTFEQFEKANIDLPTTQFNHLVRFNEGFLLFITYESVPEAHDIFKRFGNVFEQTYTRFLDLKKAEAQAREAQIETALERVRSRSMAMHKSRELEEVIQVVYEQFVSLDINIEHTGFILDYKENDDMVIWLADQNAVFPQITLPYFDCAHWNSFKEAKKKGRTFFANQLGFEEKNKFYKDLFQFIPELPEEVKEHYFTCPALAISTVLMDNVGLYIENYDGIPFSEKENNILMRFGKVFQQTYTRFLDLQNAEAQNRESQIQLSLERIRARTMAMQHSDELIETSELLFQQIKELGIEVWSCGYSLWYDNDSYFMGYNPMPNGKMGPPLKIPLTEDVFFKTIRKAKREGRDFLVFESKGKSLAKTYEYMDGLPVVGEAMRGIVASGYNLPKYQVTHCGFFSHGHLMFITHEHYFEAHDIFKRFTKEFQQTYTRFLDLQKAEAQARESQIEAALEKVRSRSLAMQKPEELQEVVAVVAEKLKDLGVIFDAGGVILCTYFPDNKDMLHWIAVDDFSTSGRYLLPYFDTPILSEAWDSKLRGDAYFSKEFTVEAKNQFFEYAFEHSDYKHFPEDYKQHVLQAGTHRLSGAWSKNSAIIIPSLTGAEPSESDAEIMKRFAKVFEQAYIRFMDLQKAEAQNREAKIEASLEKVRSVALSLQKSDDMLDIAKVLYEQLLELGFNDIRNAIIDIHNDETETFLDYDYSHDMSSAITEFSYYGDPVIEQQIEKTLSANDAFFEIELKGEQLEELIETRLRNGEQDDPRLHKTDHLTYNLYSFGNGAIGISNFGILSEEQKKVLKRFRNVFTFAYKRYTDLANAEAQAKEAKIEASLEKVRSVALGINESTDLLLIAKALYEQLLELGFSDIRNALIDVNNEDDETFLDYDYSHEMGGTVTLMSYDDDPTLEEQVRIIAATTDGFSEMVLEGQQLQDLIEMRRNNGEADDPRLLQTDSVSYNLYAFGNGAVGISNFGVLSKDQKSILDRFRNVFTFAYQRFRDLQVKEEQSAALLAEKQQLEKTLTDLQQTQKQLIQSEKMASLGELTAGIAHEIQNPLNFVNNFSEVSNELIDEMNEEIERGDLEEAKYIAKDIKQNLEKINHHGKRADAIVKGMLQHSRKSTAEKDPTDINKLADEYVRLAYHGLRAKDKSFNATLETDFDESIGLVKVVPQDMGRVILNLITNAFYAVNEKKKSYQTAPVETRQEYQPTVSVSTKKENEHIIISVQDNGNGIPKHVVDKIFQPFFTTKPTGEGTGLGLSMSYDILTKGHGGELKVETKEQEGTTFFILIPV